MKTEDTQLDQLTRALMQDAIEKPSASLVGLVMERIVQEEKTVRKQRPQVSWLPVFFWIAGGLLVYLLLAVGAAYLLLAQPGEASGLTSALPTLLPLITVVLGGASLFFFFTQLDTWMRWKQSKN